MGEHNFWIEMRDGSPTMVWKNGGCRAATQPELELSDANRELTRQVEQLRARVDAADKHVRNLLSPENHREYEMMNWAMDEFRAVFDEAALTAPPSSSDPGRADTTKESP